MNHELVVNATPEGITLALLRDKRLIELHQEKQNNQFSVGDIYLGSIKKIMPGLNAAFVELGHEKDAFLHYLDLGPRIRSLNKYVKLANQGSLPNASLVNFELEPEIEKTGKITQVLQKGQHVLVQVVKEPIGNKGPRLSSELSLAGRYVVLVPFNNSISVSKKIRTQEERNRLRTICQNIVPKNFGIIIRTVAEGKGVQELLRDIQTLIDRWEHIYQQLHKAKPIKRVLGEINKTSTILRDMLSAEFQAIHVNDQTLFSEIKEYVRTISPEMENIVRFYSGKNPVFEQFGIDKQIKTLFGKTVSFHGGSYLVIEHTEALHVIDVNSGSKSNSEINQEENALNVNLEATAEIARQLRLRDMGGIIVIDFIDLRSPGNRRKVYDRLVEEMKADRAKHKILPMSKFGLVQITRQRVRPEMAVNTQEICPMCKGSGEVTATIVLVDEIKANLDYIIKSLNVKKLELAVHPYVAAYLTKGFFTSVAKKWARSYGVKLKVREDSAFHMAEYRFFYPNGEEITI